MRVSVSVNVLIGSHCWSSWRGAAAKDTAMTREAVAVDDRSVEGAGGDPVTAG